MEGSVMGNWMKAIMYIIGSAFLTRLLPSSFFRNVDTMVHEFGHALATLGLSGRVMSISLNADHSGVTYSSVEAGWRVLMVSLSGYMAASLFAWLLFHLYAKKQYRAGLIVISVIAGVSLLLFVRNNFGMLWLAGLLALNIVLLLFAGNTILKYYFLFLSFLSLEESVMGPIVLLQLSLRQTGGAGDAALLAAHTLVPAIIWAALFIGFALWCAKNAIVAFVGRDNTPGIGRKRKQGVA
jgi:hypothetical protein